MDVTKKGAEDEMGVAYIVGNGLLIKKRTELLAGTVQSSKKLVDGTVPSCKKLVDGTMAIFEISKTLFLTLPTYWPAWCGP